jgi:branched-chain amino acid aminotransferase
VVACNAGFPPGKGGGQISRVSWTWCNGEFLKGPLAVSPIDRGLTNGLGLFETLLAVDGKPVALELHLARMTAGAERLGWSFEGEEIEPAIAELLVRCGLERGRSRVRVAMTAGAGDLKSLERGPGSLLWITATPCPLPPASVTLATVPFPRNERSPLAGLKCASYAENLIALDHARRSGADEALFFNTRDELCEAASANVFVVVAGKVLTPPLSSGCLPGTMRAQVLDRCEELGLPAEEVDLSLFDLVAADEVFITSSTRGVVPVDAIDGRPILSGTVAERLRSALSDERP